MSNYWSTQARQSLQARRLPERIGSKREQMRKRAVMVKALQASGMEPDRIRTDLGLTYGQLKYIYNVAGIPWVKGTRGRKRQRTPIQGERLRRLQEIREQYLLGFSAKDIGLLQDPPLSRERVRQLLATIRKELGREALERNYVTFCQAQELVGATLCMIKRLSDDGLLICHEYAADGSLVLGPAGLAELMWLLGPDNQQRCKNPGCDKLFTPSRRNQFYCTRECNKRWRWLERSREGYYTNPGKTKHCFDSWQALLVEALEGHVIPSDDRWVGLMEAIAISRIPRISINWLRKTGVLHTAETSKLNRYGQPAKLYATSELLIAKEVYATWRTTKSARSK